METFPMHKVRKIIEYWNELSLPWEMREKRMREKGDAFAQSVLDSIIEGKIEAKVDEKESQNADPKTLDRFLGLGINPEMLVPKQITPKKEN